MSPVLLHQLLHLQQVLPIREVPRHDLPLHPRGLGSVERLLQPLQVTIPGGSKAIHTDGGVGLVPRGVVRAPAELLVADPVLISGAAVVVIDFVHENIHRVPLGSDSLLIVLPGHGPRPRRVHLGEFQLHLPVREAPRTAVVVVPQHPQPRHPQLPRLIVLILQVHLRERRVQRVVHRNIRRHPARPVPRRGQPPEVKIIPDVDHRRRRGFLRQQGHLVGHVLLGVVVGVEELGAAVGDAGDVVEHGHPALLRAPLGLPGAPVVVAGRAPVPQGEEGEAVVGHLDVVQRRGLRHGTDLSFRSVHVAQPGQASLFEEPLSRQPSHDILIHAFEILGGLLGSEIG
mmetsp:Transcript_117235/g.269248  ORF Transcript_117235/g.269248 Transcript_117235/m.269248 type:complete len:343 (-) Transcript_117235:274-1302(-)